MFSRSNANASSPFKSDRLSKVPIRLIVFVAEQPHDVLWFKDYSSTQKLMARLTSFRRQSSHVDSTFPKVYGIAGTAAVFISGPFLRRRRRFSMAADAEEETRKQEMREAAAKELADWYKQHEETVSKTRAANR